MQLLRTFIHVFLYMPLGAALHYAFRHYGQSLGKTAFAAQITASAFGLLDEAVKMFLPGREFDVIDWVCDVVGIGAGILLAMLCGVCAALIRRIFFTQKEEVS